MVEPEGPVGGQGHGRDTLTVVDVAVDDDRPGAANDPDSESVEPAAEDAASGSDTVGATASTVTRNDATADKAGVALSVTRTLTTPAASRSTGVQAMTPVLGSIVIPAGVPGSSE